MHNEFGRFLHIIFLSVYMYTLRQIHDSGSHISDGAHAPLFGLLQPSSILRNGMGVVVVV